MKVEEIRELAVLALERRDQRAVVLREHDARRQRLQEAKLTAKKENRTLLTGSANDKGEIQYDVQTACQQACPTDAIVFGNQNDQKSAVSVKRHDNALRLFYSLEQIHTLPNVSYLTKVRNTDVLSAHATNGDLLDDQQEAKKPEAHG